MLLRINESANTKDTRTCTHSRCQYTVERASVKAYYTHNRRSRADDAGLKILNTNTIILYQIDKMENEEYRHPKSRTKERADNVHKRALLVEHYYDCHRYYEDHMESIQESQSLR